MALHYIFGDSGAGKSRFLCRTILQLAKEHPEKKFLVIVPEQFTLQTQKEFVTLLPGTRGIMNIDVLSFLRLAYRVFEKTGDRPVVLEDTGKSMIVKKVAMQCEKELELFGRNVRKTGFISEIKSVISEFYQYGIGEEEWQNMLEAAAEKPALKKKLGDLELLYHGFQDFLADRYITTEGVLDLLRDRAPDCGMISGSTLCLDGFTGFTPSQYKLLETLLKTCAECYVTVTLPPELVHRTLKEHELFYLSSKTVRWLDHLAAKSGHEIGEPTVLQGRGRYGCAPALRFLAGELFRPGSGVFSDEQQSIGIFSHKNLQDEIMWTVTRIYQLVKQEGFRYRDIAVVTADLDSYADGFLREFGRAKLPCFIDRKKKITDNPVVGFIQAAIEVVERDFSGDAVFHYMKSPLSGFSAEECDSAENYILALGIRHFSGYAKEWTRTPRSHYPCPLEELNAVRVRLAGQLESCGRVMRGSRSTTTERLTALFGLLAERGAEQYLEEKAEEWKESDPLRAREYGQLWRILLDIFDRMAGLLGDDRMSLREFADLLQTGFDEAKVGLVPPGIDQIVVGDMERTRLSGIRVLFFLGMNEGIVPKPAQGGGVLSEQDRQLFSERGIELAPTRRQAAFLSEFYLYLNLTKPSDRLFLSCRRMDAAGKAMRPSYLLARVQRLFARLPVQEAPEDDLGRCLGTDAGLSRFLSGIQRYLEDTARAPLYFRELYLAYFSGRLVLPLSKEAVTAAAFYRRPEQPLTTENAARLYGAQLSGSVTRLEQYAACAFSHFLGFGLELEERAEYQLRLPDIGTIYHEALQRFSERMKEEHYRWHDVPQEEAERLLGEAVDDAVKHFGKDIFDSTSRNAWLLVRIRRMLRRTIAVVQSQIRSGDFEPELFEYAFTHADRYLSLRGRIDRIDLCEEEGRTYLRIVDYKSGTTQFSLERLYYGLQLQLAVYMGAALEWAGEQGKENVAPAGMLYYRIDDPLVAKSDDAGRAVRRELAMNGLVSADSASLVRQDRSFFDASGGLAAGVTSEVIPAATLKSGLLSARSMAVEEENFYAVLGCARETLFRNAERIMHGDVEPAPYRRGTETACGLCSFRDSCGFDPKLAGYRYRTLEKIDAEDLWDRIREGGGELEGDAENSGGTEGDSGTEADLAGVITDGTAEDSGTGQADPAGVITDGTAEDSGTEADPAGVITGETAEDSGTGIADREGGGTNDTAGIAGRTNRAGNSTNRSSGDGTEIAP